MDGLLNQAVRLAVENTGGDRGFVAFSSGGGRLDVVAQHGLGRDRARRLLRVVEGVIGHRLAESGPLFSSRVAADPRFSEGIVDALDGVGSLVCVPLNIPSQAVGLVYVDRLNDNLLGAFKQRELNLLAVLANSTGVAIVEAQRSLLLQENQVLRQQLKSDAGHGARGQPVHHPLAAHAVMLDAIEKMTRNNVCDAARMAFLNGNPSCSAFLLTAREGVVLPYQTRGHERDELPMSVAPFEILLDPSHVPD